MNRSFLEEREWHAKGPETHDEINWCEDRFSYVMGKLGDDEALRYTVLGFLDAELHTCGTLSESEEKAQVLELQPLVVRMIEGELANARNTYPDDMLALGLERAFRNARPAYLGRGNEQANEAEPVPYRYM